MDIKKIFWILSWLVAGVTFAMILIHYGDIPDEVPMHFDATGVVDRYGSKNELFILPILSALLILLFQFMTGKSIKINNSQAITIKNATGKALPNEELSLSAWIKIDLQSKSGIISALDPTQKTGWALFTKQDLKLRVFFI